MRYFRIVLSFIIFTLFLLQILLVTVVAGVSPVEEYNLNRFSYTQKELDKSDLYYFEARYYDAKEQNRFLSVDPVAGNLKNPQSHNRYAFCLNNPLKYVDPNGKKVVPSDEFMDLYLDELIIITELQIYESLDEKTDFIIPIEVNHNIPPMDALGRVAATTHTNWKLYNSGVMELINLKIEVFPEVLDNQEFPPLCFFVKELINAYGFVFADQGYHQFWAKPIKVGPFVDVAGELPSSVFTVTELWQSKLLGDDPRAYEFVEFELSHFNALYDLAKDQYQNDPAFLRYLEFFKNEMDLSQRSFYKIYDEFKERAEGKYGPWQYSPFND